MDIIESPLPWSLQDIIVLFLSLSVFYYAAKNEKRPAQFLLEAFAFCFLYAAVYENGAVVFYHFYVYGKSIATVGVVPLSVPLIEFVTMYAALVILAKMRVPQWAKPLLVGFLGMLQDLSLDPLAVRQVFTTGGVATGRWSWISLGAHEANFSNVPVYNFSGWVLILGLGSAALLLGRRWHEKSGYRTWVGIAYPFLAALAGLLALALPSSQFFLWAAPFFKKGGSGEWVMFIFWFVFSAAILAFLWKGKMSGRLSLASDWPAIVAPAVLHVSDLVFAIAGGFGGILWIEVVFGGAHLALIGFIWRRGMAASAA